MKHNSKFLSLLLALVLCFTALPISAFAVTPPNEFLSGGSGTQDDPWLISTAADLKALADYINSGNAADCDADADVCGGVGNFHGYYFKQTADIDLQCIENWEPIGYNGSTYFAGNYDGDGHTICNAKSTGKVDAAGYATAGIFGWVAFGSVSNLHVRDVDFSAIGVNNYSYVGGLASIAFASEITNCSVSNSTLHSDRSPDGNNCAGGLVGYATGSTFSQCAAINNNVSATAYCGGFVGEQDDDNDVGTSEFKDCYVADSSITASTDAGTGWNFAGGFCGEITADVLKLTNCFVYNTSITIPDESQASANMRMLGILAGNLYTNLPAYAATINSTNCYYGKVTLSPEPATTGSDAQEMSEQEFADGTVANRLGSSFMNGSGFPILGSSPADYSDVDAAIAEVNALDRSLYTDLSAVDAAVANVVRGHDRTRQSDVDDMAQTIRDAVAALVLKGANYTAVDAAIAKADALNKDDYLDFTAVEAAISAVDRSKNITQQAEVDTMAQDIEAALAALQAKPTPAPTQEPTPAPTAAPTAEPTAAPTQAPAQQPAAPVQAASAPAATQAPTATPTAAPVVTATPAPAATTTIPATGDSANIALLWVLLVVSGGVVWGVKKKLGD